MGNYDLSENVDDALLDADPYLILDKEWRHWSYLEIVEWICCIDNGRFNQYKQSLFHNMKYRKLSGKLLPRLTKLDLSQFFGVTQYSHIIALYEQIQLLAHPKRKHV